MKNAIPLRTAYDHLAVSPDDLGDDDGPELLEFITRCETFVREVKRFPQAWKEVVRRGTLIESRVEAAGLLRRIEACELFQTALPTAMQRMKQCKNFADWAAKIGLGYDEETDTNCRIVAREGDLEELKDCIWHLDRVLASRPRQITEEQVTECDPTGDRYFEDELERAAESAIFHPELIELFAEIDVIHLDAESVHADAFRNMIIEPGLGSSSEAKLAAAQLIEHLEGLNEGESKSADEDGSAYRPAAELWPEKFDTYKTFQVAFEKIPESTIRRRRPRTNRLEIHAGDWVRYFAELDKKKAELLDEETHQEILADIEAQIAEARSKKSRRK